MEKLLNRIKAKRKEKKMWEESSKYADINVSFLYGFGHILTLEVKNMNTSDSLI